MDFGDLSRAQGSLLVPFCAIFCTDQKKTVLNGFYLVEKRRKREHFISNTLKRAQITPFLLF